MSARQRLCSADLRELAEWAEERGWAWELTGSGHVAFSHVSGPRIVMSKTPRAFSLRGSRGRLNAAVRRAEARA